ncbi:MAG TPA: CcmD family protein [bacterium]|nr:CcmD family protein [bacterium]
MNNLWYLFAAYTIIWAVIWGYTLRLGKRQTLLLQEIKLLKAHLDEEQDRQEHQQ